MMSYFCHDLPITRHLIDLAAPQIAFFYRPSHTVRIYYSCGAGDLHVFGAADTRGDEVAIITQTTDLLTPQARSHTCKDGEIKADLLSWKPQFFTHCFFFVFF